MSLDLRALRAAIIMSDTQLIQLLAHCNHLSQEIGRSKLVHNLPVFDSVREQVLLEQMRDLRYKAILI